MNGNSRNRNSKISVKTKYLQRSSYTIISIQHKINVVLGIVKHLLFIPNSHKYDSTEFSDVSGNFAAMVMEFAFILLEISMNY